MIDQSLARSRTVPAPETTEERRLHALEDRYHNELMVDEERMLLLDQIRRIRKQLRA